MENAKPVVKQGRKADGSHEEIAWLPFLKINTLGGIMKKFLLLIFGLFVLFLPGITGATILTFDDIPGGSIQNYVGDMPTYKGFNFSSTLDWIDLERSYWNYGAHSGDFGIINNTGGVGIITEANGADFTFDGLWAKRWGTAPDSGGTDLVGYLSGYNNGSLVWSVTTGINGTYEYYSAQAGLIDELRLGLRNYFIVDDLALNESTSQSPVPEPATMALFGLGLLGVAGVSRRRKQA